MMWLLAVLAAVVAVQLAAGAALSWAQWWSDRRAARLADELGVRREPDL